MKKTTLKRSAEYSLFPLAFFISGLLFFYLALSPYLNLFFSGWQLFSSDTDLDQGGEINTDIFGQYSLEGYDEYVPSSLITYPRNNTKYAEITIEAENTAYTIPLYFGDSSKVLRRGAGQYLGSHFPGESGTILVSGHNNTYFNCLQYLKPKDVITVKTNYGTYRYEVTETAIKKNTDKTAYDLRATYENLVLYTCYPFDQLGLTPDRYFVYTKLLSGPKILLYE